MPISFDSPKPAGNIILSLIVPVYNVEKYIEACLNSVFRQIPKYGVEIILVDDGSPDGSMDIVRNKFARWIDNGTLILLKQSNKGPGSARNLGLELARGGYIGFLDSDDVLLDGYFDELIDRLKLGVADVIEFGFIRFMDKSMPNMADFKALYQFSGLQKLANVRSQVFSAGCWFPSLRVFRRRYFEQFRFPEIVHYEDLMTIPFVYRQDMFIYFIDKPLLGYRDRHGSITSMHTVKQLNKIYAFYQSIPEKAEGRELGILKLKVARMMIYFYDELTVPDFPIGAVLDDVRALRINATDTKFLHLADWLLLKFPLLYLKIDSFRVPILLKHRNIFKKNQ